MADLRGRARAATRAVVGSQARPVALILLAFVVVAVVVVTFGHDWSQAQATMVGGAAVLAAALVAFRQGTLGRQEQARDRAQAERVASEAHDREVRRELHERFARLAELLGSEAGSTSAAAVSGLARLADDWAARGDLADRDVCIEAVCSVLRQKRDVKPVAHATAVRELRQHRSTRGHWGATFWHPAQADPDNHGSEPARWAGARLDLSGADLENAVLVGVDLSYADLRRRYG